ncbi:farnesyltransferase, CAAX box, beta [Hyaloraphidium curvatum]|nr:farnesyltransferase, CAAX box, beta [Hyaloraphidium curvatum]
MSRVRTHFDDEGVSTVTSEDQIAVENSVDQLYTEIPPEERLEAQRYRRSRSLKLRTRLELVRDAHVRFLMKGLGTLSKGYTSLDASKPWICYWILHSLDMLGALPPRDVLERSSSFFRVLDTLLLCQNETGGFGGGFGQISHLATTYAATHAIAVIGLDRGFESIKRPEMLSWLLSLKQPDGSFIMHDGGEVDVRGSYCAMTVAKLLGILTPELTQGVSDFVVQCQTFEGGIGGTPFVEAHGGYTFCGLAAATLLGQADLLDTPALLRWAAARQMDYEGGFQGRTNKLVDGCYSLWQGGVFPLLHALSEYVLVSGQNRKGGLRDKPDKSPDFYHTCYCLSGLSLTQYDYSWDPVNLEFSCTPREGRTDTLRPTHPIHNVCIDRISKMMLHTSSVR